jgi:KDO2-lipid IV(A) lauroyltransferase
VLLFVFSLLPVSWSRSFFRGLGSLASHLPLKEIQGARENIAFAFPDLDAGQRDRIYRDCYRQLGANAGEVVKIAATRMKVTPMCTFTPGSREVADSLRGVPTVFITGHIGNWELMAAWMAEQGYSANTIAKASYDPRLTRLISDSRERRSVHCLWKGDPKIKDQITGIFMGGGWLGFLMDQDTKVPSVFAEFFGKKAYTPSMPAYLVHRYGLQVVTLFIHRQGDDSHQISMRKIDTFVPEGGDPIVHLTTVFNRAIESEIRAHPHEWVWMHRRWKTQPQ